MVKVLSIGMSERYLYIDFKDEDIVLVIDTILKYLCDTKHIFFYLCLENSFVRFDKDRYYKKIPELTDVKEYFFQIKKEDALDAEFILNVLIDEHLGALYIIHAKEGDEGTKIMPVNKNRRLQSGYCINEMWEDYICLERSYDMPEWDLEKMGICSIKNSQ